MDIRIKNLCKAYHGKQVLDHINLSFSDQEKYCMMAPSGYGKTTLLRIMMGLEQADSGSISGLEGLRLAPVFQEDRLCENLSVSANIRLTARNPVAEAEIAQCLAELGLQDCLRQPARELSGGMKRRVAIARALLSGGDLLLMDEPFKGLDAECKDQVISCVRERTADRTVIWVTHDPEEAEQLGGQIVDLQMSAGATPQ